MNAPVIRVRFAPSPTGYLHIGSARTALYNWLFARRHAGTYVLRIEDTDRKRNTPEALAAILDGLRWLGLEADEGPEQGGPYGPYFQSQRGEIYARAIDELRKSDALYPCFCTQERLEELRAHQRGSDAPWRYDGRCRSIDPGEARARIDGGEEHTWRLKVDRPGSTSFTDLIRGPTTVEHADVEDIVLVRRDGSPTYNLAVVIDDHGMAITHVIRGQDHLTNSFKQILIYRALGWDVPVFAHISLILAPPPHSGKLSKRHGGAEVKEYRDKGYDPEALINWLALIGWSYGGESEILSREELIASFDMANAGKANAKMNPSKLDALSGHRIRELDRAVFKQRLEPHLIRWGYLHEGQTDYDARLDLLAEMIQPRIDYYEQAAAVIDWSAPDYAVDAGARKALRKTPAAAELLAAYADTLPEALPAPAALEEQARAFASERGLGFGKFAKAVRAAVTGRTATPPLFHCMCLLGREETVRRLRRVAEVLDDVDAAG
jgi:glutamyl-tRNA synthetase